MTTATSAAYTEEFVEVAGARVQLRKGGKGEPLLVLHSELGIPGWLRAYEELAQHFTVYVPSLPGFGQSSRPEFIASVRDLAAWVTWFARDMKLPQPMNVVGFSTGGWVAAEIATVNSTIFKRMVLVGAAGLKPVEGEIWDYFVHSGKEAFEQAFYDPARSPEYARYYGKDWTPEEAEQVEVNREMAARLLWKPYMRSHTLLGLLPGIQTPTLLVWGREDKIVPPDACQLYQTAIRGATATVLGNCGHMPEMEKPEEFVDAVLEFLTPSAQAAARSRTKAPAV
jgi:pimeloyl-ACP methyl ester carboxylesterase